MNLDTTIAGVDGCPGGWIVVQQSGPERRISWYVVRLLANLFDRPEVPDIVAVDIPIGLPARGARACDRTARSRLGPKRGTSVFSAPIRQVLSAQSHAEASQIRFEVEGKRIAIQTWGIVQKIREVDQILQTNEDARKRLREVHPELCFYQMNELRPIELKKKSRRGKDERVRLLREHFSSDVLDNALRDKSLRRDCKTDDLLDAFAALWTARRIGEGREVRIPESPEHDDLGLPMEIVA